MRAKWPIFATVIVLGAGYLGYPYVTLYRIDTAVRRSDAAALRSLVDWYAVREGLKEDICDMVLDGPADGRPSTELPPFGESFVRGMTGNTLDRSVTPETLVSMSHAANAALAAAQRGAPPRDATMGAHIAWAFFTSPTRFSVQLRTTAAAEPIRVTMELHAMRWTVRRVVLPNELLERAGSGT